MLAIEGTKVNKSKYNSKIRHFLNASIDEHNAIKQEVPHIK